MVPQFLQAVIGKKMYLNCGIYAKTRNSEMFNGTVLKFLKITKLRAKILKIKWKVTIRKRRMMNKTLMKKVMRPIELVPTGQARKKSESQKISLVSRRHLSFMQLSSIISRISLWLVVQVLTKCAFSIMKLVLFFV